MSVFLFPVNYFGPKCAGGTIHTYLAGSLTPQVCYQDDAGAVSHSNPININSDGFSINSGGTVTNLWLDTTLNYRIIVKTSVGVTVWDLNGVSVSNVALTGGLILGANLNTNGYEIVGETVVINPTTATEVDKLKLTSNADANGYNWQFDNDTGLLDDEGKKQLIFYKVSTAVNYATVTNAATTQAPQISVDGTDPNIDLRLNAKGTGRIKSLKGLDVTGTATISSTLTVGSLDSTGDVAGNTLTAKSGGGVKFNRTDNAFAVTMNPPSGLSANYTMTLPGSNASGTLNNNGSGVLTYGEPNLSNLSGAIYTTNVIQTQQGIGLRNSSNGNVITLKAGITTSGYNVAYPTSLKSNFTQVHDVNGQVFVQVPVVVGSVSETGVTTGSLTLAQSHLNSGAQFRTYYIDLTARAGVLDSSTNLSISFPTGDIYDWVLDYFNGSAWTRNTSAGRIAVGISGGGTLMYVQGQCKARIMIPCIKDGSVYRMYYGMTVTGNWMDVNGTTHTFQAGCRRVATTANPTLNSHYPAFTGLQLQADGGTCAWDAVVTVVESN